MTAPVHYNYIIVATGSVAGTYYFSWNAAGYQDTDGTPSYVLTYGTWTSDPDAVDPSYNPLGDPPPSSTAVGSLGGYGGGGHQGIIDFRVDAGDEHLISETPAVSPLDLPLTGWADDGNGDFTDGAIVSVTPYDAIQFSISALPSTFKLDGSTPITIQAAIDTNIFAGASAVEVGAIINGGDPTYFATCTVTQANAGHALTSDDLSNLASGLQASDTFTLLLKCGSGATAQLSVQSSTVTATAPFNVRPPSCMGVGIGIRL